MESDFNPDRDRDHLQRQRSVSVHRTDLARHRERSGRALRLRPTCRRDQPARRPAAIKTDPGRPRALKTSVAARRSDGVLGDGRGALTPVQRSASWTGGDRPPPPELDAELCAAHFMRRRRQPPS
ncbi:MAG: hypothetical protein MZV49_20110 [Rhodopseudomonas palustris]|nr:hypothetical protein [Rhodopseudomonas palustris]